MALVENQSRCQAFTQTLQPGIKLQTPTGLFFGGEIAPISHPFLEDSASFSLFSSCFLSFSLESSSKTEPCSTVAGGFKDFHSDPWGKKIQFDEHFFKISLKPPQLAVCSPCDLTSSPPPKFNARGVHEGET